MPLALRYEFVKGATLACMSSRISHKARRLTPKRHDMMSASVRPHPKTRTGCKTCKRRKVKCDEQRPSCGKCLKHNVVCDYMLAQSSTGTPDALQQGNATHATFGRQSARHGNVASSAEPSTPRQEYGTLESLRMLELQMLHHYTTSTCYTFSGSTIIQTVWRVTLPQLAFQHEFVMRGILALGAQHLAYCQPERQDFWVAQAMLQHQRASSVAMKILSNVTVEDYSAIMVFAMITTVVALANPHKPGDLLLIGENAQWLFLLRGTRSISEMAAHSLRDGPLGPIFTAGARRDQLRSVPTQENYLADLEQYISTLSDDRTHEIYRSALRELSQSYNVIYALSTGELEVADVFIWPYRVSDSFLILLREHTQESLVIFAYFCVLLKRLEGHWWMQNWSTQLISQIYGLLNEECRLWIRWPMQEIGWAPQPMFSR